jgi:CRP/FNR family cyclic AMP-dependent transcriptional regulator
LHTASASPVLSIAISENEALVIGIETGFSSFSEGIEERGQQRPRRKKGLHGMNWGNTEPGKSPLRRIPLFQSVSETTIREIERKAKRLTFAKGQEIITRSGDQDDVFIMLSGIARVIIFSANGKAVNFRQIAQGDVFGEFAAIDGDKRSASVEAVDRCTVMSIDAPLFRSLMESDPALTQALLAHLVGLLRSMTARIIEFSTLAVRSRIHCELLRMARASSNGTGEYEIDPAPTHSEIAARISTHREAVSREISTLKQNGIIERRGRLFVVKKIDALQKMVDEAAGDSE